MADKNYTPFIRIGTLLLIGAALIGAALSVRRREYTAMLIDAVADGNTRLVASLLDGGADANVTGHPPDTRSAWDKKLDAMRDRTPCAESRPLIVAAEYGLDDPFWNTPDNVEIVRALLDHGARVNVRDCDGATPLLIASDGKPKTVRALLEHGADANATLTDTRFTPLMRAVLWDQYLVCRTLLEKGARVNAQEYKGRTALMIAVNGQHEAIIPLLLKWGADVKIQSEGGETAMDDARRKLRHLVPLLERATGGGRRTAVTIK